MYISVLTLVPISLDHTTNSKLHYNHLIALLLIQSYIAMKGFYRIFNAPHSPHAGGI